MQNYKHIIVEIGALVEEVREKFFSSNGHRFDTLDLKSRNQLVTDMDVKVEEYLVQNLSKLIPEAGFLTEEETTKQSDDKELKWIIDPIDGTTNFVHGIPAFAISIALEDRKGIVLGVVYEINRAEMFSAVRGEGAFLNGRPISVADNITLEDTLIATGFPYYDYSKTAKYLKALEEFMRRTRGVRRLGSAALDLAYTACGRFDAFFEYSLSPWDVAAGALIVQEAGGVVTDFNGGNDFIYGRSIIASQPNVKSEVLTVISTAFDE